MGLVFLIRWCVGFFSGTNECSGSKCSSSTQWYHPNTAGLLCGHKLGTGDCWRKMNVRMCDIQIRLNWKILMVQRHLLWLDEHWKSEWVSLQPLFGKCSAPLPLSWSWDKPSLLDTVQHFRTHCLYQKLDLDAGSASCCFLLQFFCILTAVSRNMTSHMTAFPGLGLRGSIFFHLF